MLSESSSSWWVFHWVATKNKDYQLFLLQLRNDHPLKFIEQSLSHSYSFSSLFLANHSTIRSQMFCLSAVRESAGFEHNMQELRGSNRLYTYAEQLLSLGRTERTLCSIANWWLDTLWRAGSFFNFIILINYTYILISKVWYVNAAWQQSKFLLCCVSHIED